MKILNLYAGIGGNRRLWKGHEITAIEIDPKIAAIYQEFFSNDNVIIGDAHEYLLNHYKEYDFIWSSPPCQSHSIMKKLSILRGRVKPIYPNMDLYQEIILLQEFAPHKTKWVIENVKPYYQPLINSYQKLGRHLFWANFIISTKNIKTIKNFIDKCSLKGADELKKWLGLEYKGNIYYKENSDPGQVLRNCVHPQIGKHILDCALNKQSQKVLF